MDLTEEEREILIAAEFIHRHPDQGMWQYGEGWFKPMHVGGTDGSHHSRTLRKMARKGLIDTEVNPSLSGIRNSRRYRISAGGLKAFEGLRAAASGGADSR